MKGDFGLPFALIFTIIIIGFLFAFAFPQISTMIGMGGEAQINKVVKDLDVVVEEAYHLAEGSSRLFTLAMPSTAKLCFIDLDNPSTCSYADRSKSWCPGNPTCAFGKTEEFIVVNQTILEPSSTQFMSNVWIYRNEQDIGEGYEIPALEPVCERPDCCSFCVKGGTRLYLENKGLFVEVDVA